MRYALAMACTMLYHAVNRRACKPVETYLTPFGKNICVCRGCGRTIVKER